MMIKKMKASMFYGKKEDIRYEEIEIPEITGGDVLFKVNSCWICGSDAHSNFNGIEERYKIPVILGHKLTATVYEAGPETTNIKTGDRVVVATIYGCRQCEFCVSGKENLCKEVTVFGCTFDGGFAEYMRIPKIGVERGALVKIDESITDHDGTMIEPFSCCLHGLSQLDIQPGDSVAVFGSGPIGLCHMIISRHFGAGSVCILDMVETRLEEAKALGADHSINIKNKSWKEQLYEILGENGVDIAVTAALSVAAIECAMGIVKQGGKLLIFDEIQTGFGRLGYMFACELYDVYADILTFGKAIAGGFPLAGVMQRDDLKPPEPATDSFTFAHFPVSFAAACATLDVMQEENLLEKTRKMGKYFTSWLKEFQYKYEIIGDIRGPGSMIGIELVKDRKTKELANEITHSIVKESVEAGIVFGESKFKGIGNVLKIKPPLVITESQADRVLEVFEKQIKKYS
jgi:threonine dehydrogenase-like Zn-dependent dehydrogenase